MTTGKRLDWNRLAVEAAAIVLSILIAFWIDAWWEDRKEAALGADYEARIAVELRGGLDLLGRHKGSAERSLDIAGHVEPFFDVVRRPIDGEQLIVDLYNMGRDPTDRFDISTYEDMVATGGLGLIRNAERREAIQRAYSEIIELGLILRPNRSEYLAGVRGWIPQSAIDRVREACPNMNMVDLPRRCENVETGLEERSVEALLRHFSENSAILAYRLRVQGLYEKRGRLENAIEAVEAAIRLLE